MFRPNELLDTKLMYLQIHRGQQTNADGIGNDEEVEDMIFRTENSPKLLGSSYS